MTLILNLILLQCCEETQIITHVTHFNTGIRTLRIIASVWSLWNKTQGNVRSFLEYWHSELLEYIVIAKLTSLRNCWNTYAVKLKVSMEFLGHSHSEAYIGS